MGSSSKVVPIVVVSVLVAAGALAATLISWSLEERQLREQFQPLLSPAAEAAYSQLSLRSRLRLARDTAPRLPRLRSERWQVEITDVYEDDEGAAGFSYRFGLPHADLRDCRFPATGDAEEASCGGIDYRTRDWNGSGLGGVQRASVPAHLQLQPFRATTVSDVPVQIGHEGQVHLLGELWIDDQDLRLQDAVIQIPDPDWRAAPPPRSTTSPS